MHSTLTPKPSPKPTPKPSDDPHDVVMVAPDVVRVAPSDEEISLLLQQAARFHSDAQSRATSGSASGTTVPPVDTTFRPAANVSGNGPSIGSRAARAIVALLVAACIGGAAIGWQTFGYAGKKMLVKWTPQFVLTSLPLEKWGLSPPSAAPDAEADTADATTPQAPSPALTAAAGAPSDQAQLLQSMARDLASVGREVEQLKASIEQLKANQQQISREVAKSSEQKPSEPSARPKTSALAPSRPAVARPRLPAPYPPPQASPATQAAASPAVPQAAAPYAPQTYVPRQPEPLPLSPGPTQLPAEPGFESAPRPPMPVR